jgi:nitroreductase
VRCLDAARHAPSHGRTNPFRYVVISGQEAKERLWARAQAVLPEAIPDQPQSLVQAYRKLFLKAPVWIALGMVPRREKPKPEWEELAAVSMAAQNLHLMAAAQGLGGLWASGPLFTHPRLAEYFGWHQPPDRLLGLFYLGYARRALAPRKYASLETIVRWEEA